MTIRAIRKSECGRLAAVHDACFPRGWSALELAQLVADRSVVALTHESLHAFILMRCAVDEAEMLTLAVAAAHRRNGLATELVSAAHSAVKARGAKRSFLEVSVGNEAAKRLYDAAGYRVCGSRPGYYSDGSDALVMENTFHE